MFQNFAKTFNTKHHISKSTLTETGLGFGRAAEVEQAGR